MRATDKLIADLDRFLNGQDPLLKHVKGNAHLAEWFSERRSGFMPRTSTLSKVQLVFLFIALLAAPALAFVYRSDSPLILSPVFVIAMIVITLRARKHRVDSNTPNSLNTLITHGANARMIEDLWLAGVTGSDLIANLVNQQGRRKAPIWFGTLGALLIAWSDMTLRGKMASAGALVSYVVLWFVGARAMIKLALGMRHSPRGAAGRLRDAALIFWASDQGGEIPSDRTAGPAVELRSKLLRLQLCEFFQNLATVMGLLIFVGIPVSFLFAWAAKQGILLLDLLPLVPASILLVGERVRARNRGSGCGSWSAGIWFGDADLAFDAYVRREIVGDPDWFRE